MKSHIHRVIGETGNGGNLDTTTAGDTLDVQSEEFWEGKLLDINEENGCDKHITGAPEEILDVGKTLHVRGTFSNNSRH